MPLDDFRRWLDVGARGRQDGPAVALDITPAGKLQVCFPEHREDDGRIVNESTVELDYSDAGQLLDWIREALGVLLARQGDPVAAAALAGLQASRDTPKDA